MDSLTHLAMGHAMGMFAAGQTPAATTAAYWGALVGNSLPDIDVTVGHLLGKGWSLHRKFTHTVGGVILLSVLAAGVITWAVPGSSPLRTFAWTLAGCIIHVFMDCLNTFGTRPFQPLSDKALGFGVLFIVDPLILATLGAGSLGHLAGWVSAEMVRWLYAAMWVYVAARALVLYRIRARLAASGRGRYSVSAWLLGWRFFRQENGRTEFGKADPLGRRLTVLEAVESAQGPAVEASRQVPVVANFLQRARYPVAHVEERNGLYRVRWEDLAQRLRGRRQGLEIKLDAQLRPIG